MQCKLCKTIFQPKHFNEKLCSSECKRKARAISVRQYKDTDKGRACLLRWYENPARQVSERKYRSKPKSKHLQVLRTTKYYKKYPEKKKQKDKEYAFRRRGYNAGRVDWEAVNAIERICIMCMAIEDLTIDHIMPLSKGGSNHIKNLQILCRKCNASKGSIYEI